MSSQPAMNVVETITTVAYSLFFAGVYAGSNVAANVSQFVDIASIVALVSFVNEH